MEMDKEESSVQHPRKSLRKRKAPVSVFDGEMIRGDLASFACKGRVFQEPSKALAKSMDSTHGKAEASLDKLDAHLARLAARLRRAAAAAPPPAGPGGPGEGEGEGGGGARLLGNPAAFAAVDFQPVEEVAHDAPGAGARAHAARRAGTPLVVRGPPPEEGWWAPFARPWLVAPPPPQPRRRRRRGEGEGEGEAEEAGAAAAPPAELDAAAMLRGGLGREIVPVVVRRYSQADPIHHQERLSTFLAESWGPGKAKYYLHQWQFPLSAAAARRLPAPAWHAPCARFLGGPDLLEFASRDPARGGRFTGVSPYQYLFMGAAGTGSKLHRDLGGLAVTIAPLVGEKEVTLVHRDEDGAGLAGQHVDAWRPKAGGGGGGGSGGGDGDEGGGAAAPGLARYPGLAFARCWRTTLRPGQILIVPAGTWHAARNPAPCLAYSRLHLGEAELPALARSLADQDAPEINHKLILWNALYGLSNRVLKRQDLIAVPQETSSLLALFHLCRALLPQLKAEADERKWEALVQIIENRINGEMDETQVKLEDLDSPCNWSYDASHAKRHNADANGTVERLYEDRATNGDDENGDHTVVRIDGMNCKQGDRVKIKFFKRKLLGQVLAVREAQGAGATGGRGGAEGASGGGGGGGEGAPPPGRGVDVHYDGFPRYHDELRPAEAVFERRPAPKGQGGVRAGPVVPWERLVPGLAVCVPWGKPQEMFYATVKSKYSGRMISVHYDQFGEDWDQWVKPHEIIPI